MIKRLRYIQRFKDRHGRVRIYLRRRGYKPVPLPAEDDPGFLAAYTAACAATTPLPVTNRVPAGCLEALTRSYFTSAAYRQLGDSTKAVYQRIIAQLNAKHGHKPVALLEEGHVRKMIADRAETPAAANHVLRTMRALMLHAVEEKWRTDDPARGVKRLKEAAQGAETWSESDIAKFEARWAPGTRPRLALALLLYTGQRRSDVVRMGARHVQDGVIQIRQVKTGAELFIPLHPDLANLIALAPEHKTFLITEAGRAFTPNGFYMRFKGWVEAAGLAAGRSPHGLRKAAARRLAEAGCSAHLIASITGHKTLSEVQRYTRAADQVRLARDAVLHIGRPGGKAEAEPT